MSFAWSTPGVAFILTVGEPVGGFPAVAGAFLVAAGLIVLTGLIKPLARLIAAIPSAIANAMLAGMLLTLCLAPINAVAAMPMLALPILLAWVDRTALCAALCGADRGGGDGHRAGDDDAPAAGGAGWQLAGLRAGACRCLRSMPSCGSGCRSMW